MIKETITQKDIFDAITSLRLEIMTEIKDVKGRVDVLEDFRSYVLGGFAIVTVFIGGFATWVWSKITGQK